MDESDFWRKGEVDEVRHVAERYIAKSNPYIVMVSTPNAPNGLFDKIEREPEDTVFTNVSNWIIHMDLVKSIQKQR